MCMKVDSFEIDNPPRMGSGYILSSFFVAIYLLIMQKPCAIYYQHNDFVSSEK